MAPRRGKKAVNAGGHLSKSVPAPAHRNMMHASKTLHQQEEGKDMSVDSAWKEIVWNSRVLQCVKSGGKMLPSSRRGMGWCLALFYLKATIIFYRGRHHLLDLGHEWHSLDVVCDCLLSLCHVLCKSLSVECIRNEVVHGVYICMYVFSH
jgi:hypothetical protein